LEAVSDLYSQNVLPERKLRQSELENI